MSKVLVVANQKGGEAKTTTVNAVGAGLTKKGFKVLYIDLDGQRNLTYILQALNAKITAFDVLRGEANAKDAITKTEAGDIIPGSKSLALIDLDEEMPATLLKNALEEIKAEYDFIIIDTPPAVSIRTVNAIVAADYLIIPAQADIFSLQGIGQLTETITRLKQTYNNNLTIGGIVLTRYSGRANLTKDLAEIIRGTASNVGIKLYSRVIREAVAAKEANASRTNIFDYAPNSNPAKDYAALVNEILADLYLIDVKKGEQGEQ